MCRRIVRGLETAAVRARCAAEGEEEEEEGEENTSSSVSGVNNVRLSPSADPLRHLTGSQSAHGPTEVMGVCWGGVGVCGDDGGGGGGRRSGVSV